MNFEGISWRAYEYVHRPKNSDWYWAVGIVAVSAILVSIFFNDIVLAILIAIAAAALLLHADKMPRLLTYHLTERGLIIENQLYPLNTIESFWVEQFQNGEAKIILKSTKKMMVYIIAPLVPEIHPDEVRVFFLKRKIPEVEHHEPLSQQLMEYLGF